MSDQTIKNPYYCTNSTELKELIESEISLYISHEDLYYEEETSIGNKSGSYGAGGAAAGATLGSFILPGLGTLIGGVLGGIFGSNAGEGVVETTVITKATELNRCLSNICVNPNGSFAKKLGDYLENEKKFFASLIKLHVDYSGYPNTSLAIANEYIQVFTLAYKSFPKETSERLAEMYYIKAMCLFNTNNTNYAQDIFECLERYENLKPSARNDVKKIKINTLTKLLIDLVNEKKYSEGYSVLYKIMQIDNSIFYSDFNTIKASTSIDEELNIAAAIIYNNIGKAEKALEYIYCALVFTKNPKKVCNVIYDCYKNLYTKSHNKIISDVKIVMAKLGSDKTNELLKILNGILVLLSDDKEYELVLKYIDEFKNQATNEMNNLKIVVAEELLLSKYKENKIEDCIKYGLILSDDRIIKYVQDSTLIVSLYCFIDVDHNKNADMLYAYLHNKLGDDIRLESALLRILLNNNDKSKKCYQLCLGAHKSFGQYDIKYLLKIFDLFNAKMQEDKKGQDMLLHCFNYINIKKIANSVINVALSKKDRLGLEMLSAFEKAYKLIKDLTVLERLALEYSLIDKPTIIQYETMFLCIDVSLNVDDSIIVKACNFLLQQYEIDCTEIKYLLKLINRYSLIANKLKRPFCEYCTYLGIIYKKYGYFEKAEFYIGRALIDNADFILAGYEEIDILLNTAKYKKADELIEYFLERNLNDDRLLVFKGKYYYYNGDILNAENTFEKALSVNPQQIEARDGIAQLGNMTAERQKSIEQYINILQINQNDINAHLNIGVLYLHSGNDKDSENHFKKAIFINAEMIEPYIYLVQIYLKREDFQKAESCFEELKRLEIKFKINDENIKRNIDLISALIDQFNNKFKEAKNKYTAMLALYDYDYRLYNNLAAILFEQNNLKEYIELLEKAYKLDSNNGIVEGNLKIPLLCEGKFKDFIDWFENSESNIERVKLYAVSSYMECGFIDKSIATLKDINIHLLNKSDYILYLMLETIALAKEKTITPEKVFDVLETLSQDNISSDIYNYLINMSNELSYDCCRESDKIYDNYKELYYADKKYVDTIYNRLAGRIKVTSDAKFEELPEIYKGFAATNLFEINKINIFNILGIKVSPILETSVNSCGEWDIIGSRMEGGMACVTKVFNKKRNILGALKELKPKLLNNKTTSDNFKNEAYFLSDRLNHKNIVRVFSDSIDVYKCSYVMEYLGGGNLRKIITARRLSKNEIYTVLISVFEALNFFHNLGERYIHLDVTPENIMFNEKGEVKLTDFGISYFRASTDINYTDVEDDTALAGKLPYMAPEILSGDIKSQKADQYSLGVIAYELFGGKLPYEPEDIEEASEFAWILCANEGAKTKLQDLNTDISEELSNVIHKMIHPEPVERYPTIALALSDFKNCLGDSYCFDNTIKNIEITKADKNKSIGKTAIIENIDNPYSFENWLPSGYRITGATCYISKVFNEALNLYGALKILKSEYINNNALKSKFLDEAYFLSKVDSKGFIKAYKDSIDEQKACYVMEWIDGKTLDEIALNDSEMTSLFLNISKVMAEFHFMGKNYVHLDISPQNIMISNDGQVYLIDFGSGFFGQQYEKISGRKGKYPYIAPEIYKNNEVSQKADVYSLGVVFYKMLTGKFPISPKIENAPEHIWANAIINDEIPNITSVSPNLNKNLGETIMKMLDKEPKERLKISDAIFAFETINEEGGIIL